MGFWKGLVDKVAQKTEELEAEAKRRASKKAAELALDTGKAAARAAVKNAGRTLDYAGKRLEEAIFGEASSDGDGPRDAPASGEAKPRAPDPFAKLKADEARKKAAALEEKTAAREREASRVRSEREVDDELAALKKKIRDR